MAITVPPGYYNLSSTYAVVRTGQVSVGTTPTLILPHNQSRLGAVITNAGTATVFIGKKSDVANGNGHALLVGNSISLMTPATLYGAVAAATQLVTFLEEQTR